MRPGNEQSERHELLEDILGPEPGSAGVASREVLALIEHARQRRVRRRRFVGATLAACGAAGWITWMSLGWSEDRPRALAQAPDAPELVTPLSVEKVNDEQALALLEEMPAAMVRWPDGRQTLLVLVAADPGVGDAHEVRRY